VGEKFASRCRGGESLFRFAGLADFLHFLDWSCGLVRTRDELAEAAHAFSGGWQTTHGLRGRHRQPDPTGAIGRRGCRT